MVKNTVCQFVASNLCPVGLDILKMREHQKQSVHFVLAFWENYIYTLHLCFSQDIAKYYKVYTKADSWFQKSYEEFEQLQTSSGKYKNLKFHGLLSKTYIPSAETLYTEDLSIINVK